MGDLHHVPNSWEGFLKGRPFASTAGYIHLESLDTRPTQNTEVHVVWQISHKEKFPCPRGAKAVLDWSQVPFSEKSSVCLSQWDIRAIGGAWIGLTRQGIHGHYKGQKIQRHGAITLNTIFTNMQYAPRAIHVIYINLDTLHVQPDPQTTLRAGKYLPWGLWMVPGDGTLSRVICECIECIATEAFSNLYLAQPITEGYHPNSHTATKVALCSSLPDIWRT